MKRIKRMLSARPRIAFVVLGSLLAGLLLPVALVMFPLAGAPENLISGSVLLSFAFGWAALGFVSVRFTTQPQRWAAMPATLMGVAGVTLLAWPDAVTNDLVAWLWPPAAVLLAAWMLSRSRKALRSRTSFALLYPVFGLQLLFGIAGGYERVQESRDRASHAMPGRLVEVGDHRLHINCTGSGSPTVVLEPGLGEPSSVMAGWIAPAVAAETRVCIYDRAGRGWSESAKGPKDGEAVASDLHTLLERAGETGPYVLAGHSSGGAYVLNFARLYPDEVAGVVLLDSMHPDQYEKLPGWRGFYAGFRRVSAVLPSLARVGVGRLIALTTAGELPPAARSEERAFWSEPRHYRSLRDEVSELRTALTQAGKLKSLGSTPLMVVTAVKNAQDGWQPLQDDLARLSTSAAHRNLPGETHESLVTSETGAAASTRAILDIVESARVLSARPIR